MKLVPWLLALHLAAIALASAVAIPAECTGDKLRALCMAFMITGWITALSAAVFLVRTLIKGRRVRDIVLLIILVLIGLDESRMATRGWEYLIALPG